MLSICRLLKDAVCLDLRALAVYDDLLAGHLRGQRRASDRGGEDFGGGANVFLQTLECEIVPAVRAETDAPCILAGYSLAGLCAVYAAYRTTAFSGVISASGSLWFPGFLDFAASHAFARKPERIYFSLGDRESRTKNPVMRLVEDNTRKLCEVYAAQGIETTFELNPGNHFQDAERRIDEFFTGEASQKSHE